MKIYTKRGDTGRTKLLGGTSVSKSNIKVDAYGNVDELNAFIGHLKDQLKAEYFEEKYTAHLHAINIELFNLGSILAADANKYKGSLPELKEISIELLEELIDEMDRELEPLKNFILPGGHPVISMCHICRTVCRRAERKVVELGEVESINPLYIQYLNRMSDFLFTLSRYIAYKWDIPEEKWTGE
ncbi:cob(I)yrinic acid a,c-diamide adenosyltransferase [Membranihabitans maritimus]|uniref:cob(I)yrinic acid a,c-diamide adenosyltransferase n=1 Tax=Membranihabitans maritimus TaxID=2904244 RepID=UPI001EFF81E4|nr:cob(I)yrinic acid a,c-diamide adenosyltransferase [Membranihabitans maritimus]